MEKIGEETVAEMIKSCAYGYNADELAEHYGMEKAEVEKFLKEHASDIEETKAYLKAGGFIE